MKTGNNQRDPNATITCKTCGKVKSTLEFYKDPRRTVGVKPACIECERVRCRELGRTDHEKELKRSRWATRDRDAYNAKKRDYFSRTGQRDKLKKAARAAVYYAVRTGQLARNPCSVCGSENAHAHHDDYNMKLDVRWLCSNHHGNHHRKY